MDNGELMLDARTLFHYYATGITPAMAASAPGTGSSYAFTERDSEGRYLDGGKTYKITLPAPIPVNNFWSFMVYSGQTRSMLETDQKLAGLDSNNPSVKPNADASYTMWFGPKPPPGKEGNWIQTIPGKSWNTLLRLYGPLEPWFDRTWKPGDFELVSADSLPVPEKSMAPKQERSETEGVTAIKARLTSDGRIAIYGIHFDTNEAEVKPDSMETIKNIAKVLQENPDLKIAVVGHTDSLGSHEINMRLSKLRADAVVRVLQDQHKISSKRLLAAGAGFLAPIASNDTAEGRALNRRVELIRSK
jgi:outer membrane protein OmpA-like peptidoglycan-associated protein